MSSQTLLKLFATVSLAATAAGLAIWWQTGAAPSPWLLRVAAAAFVLAILTGFVGQDTRPRLMLRFVSALFALMAVICIATDVAYPKGGSRGLFTYSAMDHLSTLLPSVVASMRTGISKTAGAAAWDPVMTSLLGLPAALWFIGLALAAWAAGRPRRRVQIFVN